MWIRHLVGVGLALALVGAAAAQTSPGAVQFLTMQADKEKVTSEMIGTAVTSSDGESVGKIAHLILDADSRVSGAVLAIGGFLGIGSKSVAVPWQALKFQMKDGKETASLNLKAEEIAKAPEYKTLAQVRMEAEAQKQRMEQQQRSQSPKTGGTGGAIR